MIEQGIYLDLSSEEYHSDKNSLSRSSIMDFKKNQRKYWAKHLNPDRPKEETKPSWVFGTAFHTLVLEPHLFEKNYFIMPEKVLLKDVGREAYDEYKKKEKEAESCESKVVLSRNDFNSLLAMRHSLLRNERAKSLIEGAVYESSYFWQDENSGLMLKSRPDILNGYIYADLKTIDDASPENYQREMAKGGYHIQAGMAKDGHKVLTGEPIALCVNICVEKQYPHCVGIYIIDELAIEQGQRIYKEVCVDMRSAISDNRYSDFPVQTIGLPKWAL